MCKPLALKSVTSHPIAIAKTLLWSYLSITEMMSPSATDSQWLAVWIHPFLLQGEHSLHTMRETYILNTKNDIFISGTVFLTMRSFPMHRWVAAVVGFWPIYISFYTKVYQHMFSSENHPKSAFGHSENSILAYWGGEEFSHVQDYLKSQCVSISYWTQSLHYIGPEYYKILLNIQN